jgi:hypothetical protein
LCLRKGKKRRKMNQSKGVLVALRNPGGPGRPREVRRTEQGVLKKGRKTRGPPWTFKIASKKVPMRPVRGPHWGPSAAHHEP